jgi:hypothetical protein
LSEADIRLSDGLQRMAEDAPRHFVPATRFPTKVYHRPSRELWEETASWLLQAGPELAIYLRRAKTNAPPVSYDPLKQVGSKGSGVP